MNCPKCGAYVPDGALWCPKCKTELAFTQKLKLNDAKWCPACGALVPEGEDCCPKCGASLDEEASVSPGKAQPRRTRKLDLPSIGNTGVIDADELNASADETHTMARIESAIPPPSDEASAEAVHDRIPHMRAIVFAVVLAVCFVGGVALYITHPWDPNATNISATEPADTSMQGYPGKVDSLKAQDDVQVSTDDEDDSSASDSTSSVETDPLTELSGYYAMLAELNAEVSSNEDKLIDDGVNGDLSGKDELYTLSIEVSNLITQIQSFGSSEYADQAQNLLTLGNWLRNRCDALTNAWQYASDGEGSTTVIAAAMAGDDYAKLFDDNYDAWDPAA